MNAWYCGEHRLRISAHKVPKRTQVDFLGRKSGGEEEIEIFYYSKAKQ
jgi:hypothetical protein